MMLEDKLGPDGDALYASLMQAHDGLTTDQSHALNACLVLMMMNEIGDANRVRTLLNEVRASSSR